MRRTITATTVALALVLAGTVLGATPVDASAGDEAWFVQQINNHRSARGLAPLQTDGGLASSARGWSEHMSRTGLAHDPNIGSAVSGWTRIGENVGYGQSRDQIWQMFLNSSQHRGNYENAGFTHVGVGVVISGGNLWVTQRFAAFGSSAPAPAPAPPVVVAPAPTPAPQVVVPAPAPQQRTPAPAGGNGGGGAGDAGGSGADAPTTSTTSPSPASAERVSLMIDALHALEG